MTRWLAPALFLAGMACMSAAFMAGRWTATQDHKARAAEARAASIEQAREVEHDIRTLDPAALDAALRDALGSVRPRARPD